MKHLGDITRLSGAKIEPVDVITGGSPCQDLSVAGKQAGLSGDRSGLFREQMRLVREMREATGRVYPQFMIWENVPGALSVNHGADFREVLNECVKIVEKTAPDVPMPEKGGWPRAGVLYDEMGRWSIAWRIHDAQFWGVPQRRRRVALVCDFRGMRAPEVLFEQQGVSGNTEQSDAQGERTACASDECITEPDKVWDARGNGDGNLCSTLTGDHDNRITDYTNVVAYGIDDVRAGTHRPVVSKGCSPTLISHSANGVCVGNGQAHDPISPSVELSETLKRLIDLMKTALPVVEDRVKSEEPWLLESNQNHATVTNAGVSTTLPASMGMGGGYVPMVTEREHSPIVIDRAAFNQGENALYDPHIKEEETMPTLVSRGPHAVCCPSNREVEVYSVMENGRRDVRLSKTAYSLTCGGGKPGQSYPCICIGNGQEHVTQGYTEEVSQTLNCMHDPMTILEPCAYQLVGVNSNSMKSSNPNSGCYETEQAGTITTNGCVPNNQGGTAIIEPVSNSKVYGICSYSSNCMKSSNPHSGVYEAETSRTLDTVSCGNPVCCQGGMAVVEPVIPLEGNGCRKSHKGDGWSTEQVSYTLNTVERHGVAYGETESSGESHPVVVDRAAFNQGKNAQFDIKIEETETVPSMVARGLHAVAQPVQYRVRRLTPLECTRLQGYPDGWVDIGDWVDSKGKKRKDADAPKYKALGNSIALPFWKWLLARIYAECKAESPDPTLGSLFDGIGGFPLSWPGRTAWSSEIDEFPLAVLRARFGEE